MVLLACVAPANGQVAIGNNFKMLLNGNLGAIYTGNSGNYIGSSHSLGFAANGTLEGYYYHPQFLNFQVRPYYDRAQSNAESQTITRGTGLESSVNVFGGGHFPGSISYARSFDSNSVFYVAGVPSVLGESSGSHFSVGWGALFSGLPSLYANYSIADSTSTLLGATSQGKSSSRNFNLNSNYSFAGFNLNGTLNHYNTEFVSPIYLTDETISFASSNRNYGVTATHRLPLSGSLGLGWTRTTTENGINDFTTNSYTASANISPSQRVSINQICTYTTNVMAALAQSLGDTPVSPLVSLGSNLNTFYTNTTGILRVSHGFTVTGYVNHWIRHFQGNNSEDTQYGGTVNFQKATNFLGFLRFSIGVVDTATREGNSGLSLVANLNMTRKFGPWETTADFSYSQFTQTLLAILTTSNYSYGGTVRRKLNSSTHWSASFRELRSGLTVQEGNNNISDSFNTNLSWGKYYVSGSYSKARGEAILGANGTLTATPIGSVISTDFLTFNARSFGINAGAVFFRRLIVSGGYTNVSSSTTRKASGRFNDGDRYSARLAFRIRQIEILAGYDRAVQTSSAVPGGPRAVNSYYLSLSRWFNVF